MKTRIFEKAGFVVSEVGLGTWQLGGDWGDVTEDAALATLRAAYEAGTNFLRAAVRRHTEASLQRLGVEALDLTQLHCVPPEVLKRGELFGWLGELQTEGKIRAYGASVEAMDEALWCVEQEGCASLQIIFNIFRQKPIDLLFAKALSL